MRHVVIIGGGFAGLWGAMGAARQIEEAGAQDIGINVTLVSRDPWLVIRPRLHEAHPFEHMRVPLRAVLDPIGAVPCASPGSWPASRASRGRTSAGARRA